MISALSRRTSGGSAASGAFHEQEESAVLNDDIPLGLMLGLLFVLVCLSAFFSSSETGMMSINRYRLNHQANSGGRAAKRVVELLKRPDRLLGVI